MEYDFFLSYTQANNDVFLTKFFDDLSQAIRDRRGVSRTQSVGFFDQRAIELGEEWDHAIVKALQSSHVFLAATSPSYFRSEYCGKTWSFFEQRLVESGKKSYAEFIQPIVWIPTQIEGMPPVAAGKQFFGDPAAIYNQRGIKYLLKLLSEHQLEFYQFIESLADSILRAANQSAIPPLS